MRQGRALGCDSLMPGPAQPPSTMAWEDLLRGSGRRGPDPHVPGQLSPPSPWLLPEAAKGPVPSPCGLWGGRTRERRCQPVASKVAKPVEASGAGTPQKEAWPRPAEACQDAGPAPWSLPRGGGGFATPDSSLQRALQGPQPQPGPDSTRKPFQTTQSVTTVTMSSKPEWDAGRA